MIGAGFPDASLFRLASILVDTEHFSTLAFDAIYWIVSWRKSKPGNL